MNSHWNNHPVVFEKSEYPPMPPLYNACSEISPMEPQEINRAVQSVTARTSFGRDAVAEILRTGFGGLALLGKSTSKAFERDHFLEYICQWTMSRTKHPGSMIRELLDCSE